MTVLEQLFGSKTRVRLLRLFFSNPDKPFYVRELVRTIDTQINSVRRELKNLQDCGIVVEIVASGTSKPTAGQVRSADADATDPGSKKFYRVNDRFPLIAELRGLFVKSPALMRREFTMALEEAGEVDYAMLTGHFVDMANASSDMLIVGSIPKPKLLKIIKSFEKELDREINFTHMTPTEFKYRKSVTDKFLFSLLEGKKIEIIKAETANL